MSESAQIAIVGAGSLGVEIAQAAALSGWPVVLHDPDARALRQAVARISRRLDRAVRQGRLPARQARRAKRVFTLNTALDACADTELIIEAIEDRLPLKRTLFQKLDELVRPNTILATSTNTLSITRLAAVTRQPGRVIGLHFPRPAHVMQLVEVVRAPGTRQEILDRAMTIVRRFDKTPILVDDSPGLIVNRVAHMVFNEALHLLDGGGLDEATIDRLMEAAGFPMGPFRLMDYLGIDRVLEVAESLYEATFHDPRYRPHPHQQRLVEAGQTGRGSVRGGFYPPESNEA